MKRTQSPEECLICLQIDMASMIVFVVVTPLGYSDMASMIVFVVVTPLGYSGLADIYTSDSGREMGLRA
jgi:hypothetical protein